MFSFMRSSHIPSLLMRTVLCGVLALPLIVQAAALGDATVRSSIGQRLDADIDIASLSSAEAESLVIRLAPADAFASAGIDYTALLRSMRFSVVKQGDRHRVHVSSDLAVSDPFLNLLVELSANGTRTIRQYALLIDPPAIEQPSEASTPPVTPAQPAATTAEAAPSESSAKTTAAASRVRTDKREVRRGETLRSIAAGLQPAGVQLEQVMVALQNSNPSAFVEGNANRIRSGSVLTVTDADTMRGVDLTEARRTLRAQTADFIRYQKQLAERSVNTATANPRAQAETSAPAGNRSSSGSVSVQLNDSNKAAATQDKLTLSTPGKAEAPGSGANSQATLDKLAADKALADANSRIAALEKNISQVQALLAIQNKSLADAQQRAADTSVKPDVKAEPDPAAKVGEAAKGTAAAPPSVEPPKTVLADNEPTAATQAAIPSQPAVSTTKAPVPARSAASSTAPSSTATGTELFTDWLQDPVALAVGGGAVLLLLGWLLMRSRRTGAGPVSVTEAEPAIAQTVIGESGGRQIDTNHSVFHSNFVPSLSQIDANEVDAIAEADVYIAYGRDEQAEEILLDALRAHPQRHVLRVKLLEIYASRNDKQKFGTLAAELRVLTHGQGAEWAQAARLGRTLDSGNHLYDASSHEGVASASLSPVEDFELKLEGLLGEQRKHNDAASSANRSAALPPIDFQRSGIDTGTSPAAPAASDIGNELGTSALNTKLELALACREIGDRDGARELLAEVAKARDPELARRANSLLQQLA